MEEKRKSGFATASLVLGIIGICTSFIPFINNASFILALIAIIFSIVALLKRASKGMAIAGIIISILAILITINSQEQLSKSLNETINTFNEDMDTTFGNNTEEILKNNVNVELGDFEVIEQSYGFTDTKLRVKVTNKTNETKSFSIQVEAVNPDGSRINNDYIYANSLSSGQSQEFNIFTYVSSENLEAMKNATFKIVEASMY